MRTRGWEVMHPSEYIMQTYTGKQVDVRNIQPEQIDIRDIAHALATTNRFGGHVEYPYSVAQHSLYVMQILPPELKFWGLAHDMGEAYLGDVIHSVKIRLPEFKKLEDDLMEKLASHFGLCWPDPPEIRVADLAVGAAECEVFGIRMHESRREDVAQGLDIKEWHWQNAEIKFLSAFQELKWKVK